MLTKSKDTDWANISLVDCVEGNAQDAYFTLKLFYLLEEKLEDRGLTTLLDCVLSPAYEMFADIEFHGMHVDEATLDDLDRKLKISIMEIEDDEYGIKEVSDKCRKLKQDKKPGINLSSNDDLINILFIEEGGFNLYPLKKTAGGKASVDKASLDTLKEIIEEELVKRNG